jgi:hypothetical protein
MIRTLLVVGFASAMLVGGSMAAARTDVGYLKVSVTPDKAGVYVDGQYFGPAARFAETKKYMLAPGQHQIMLADPRYEDATATVQIVAGKTATVTETLKPKPEPKPPFGLLKVVCRPYLAAVMLNDHYVGHVDEFDNGPEGLQVNPGTYDLRIDLSSGDTQLWERVTVTADKTTVVRCKD